MWSTCWKLALLLLGVASRAQRHCEASVRTGQIATGPSLGDFSLASTVGFAESSTTRASTVRFRQRPRMASLRVAAVQLAVGPTLVDNLARSRVLLERVPTAIPPRTAS